MIDKNKLLIGFIGQGFIGKNMADDFEDRGYNIVRYNKSNFQENKAKIAECDYVFIAVPTPSTPSGFDDSILLEVIPLVGKNKVAVIKSTIKIGTTEKIQKLHPDKYIIHSPEFLTEKNAREETRNPERNVVGYTKESQTFAQKVLDLLPKSKHDFIVPAKEAELIKYMGNNFLMLKVLYANIIYNIADKNGIDYDSVATAVACDSRIGSSHLKIKHQGGLSGNPGRGAGGHCFIKDMAALVEMYKELNLEKKSEHKALNLLESAVEFNKELLIESEKDLDLLYGVYNKE